MGYVLNQKDSYSMGAAVYGLRWDGTNLFACAAGSGNDEIQKLSVNSSTGVMTKVTGLDTGGISAQVLMDDGTYLYVGQSSQLRAKNPADLSDLGFYNLGSAINTIACDASGYIYVGCANGHIYVLTFDGSNFTLRHDQDYSAWTSVSRLLFDGLNVLGTFSANNFVRAFNWDGSSWSVVDTYSDLAASRSGIYWDGSNVYASRGSSIDCVPWDQANFGASVDQIVTAAQPTTLDGDGQYVYSAEPAARMAVYELDGSALSLVSSIADVSIPVGYYHSLCFGGGFVFWCSGNNVKSARMDLTAQLTLTPASGPAGTTFQLTGVA